MDSSIYSMLKGDGHMFIGMYEHQLDTKNRMIVPSKLREELGDKVVFTKGIDNCLYLYPMEEWEKFMAKLSKLPVSDPRARKFVRNFTSNAEECDLDKQGRVTIPKLLRSKVGIEKELTTVGCMDKIEVWSREVYQQAEEDITMNEEDIAEGMTVYGI